MTGRGRGLLLRAAEQRCGGMQKGFWLRWCVSLPAACSYAASLKAMVRSCFAVCALAAAVAAPARQAAASGATDGAPACTHRPASDFAGESVP